MFYLRKSGGEEMKKTFSERYQECYYEETMKNGLKVVVWHKPGFEKNYAVMATPMGSFDVSQIDSKGHVFNYHEGVAHFLEHKMFESSSGDVMEKFSQMGANVNAATSYDMTFYYFQTSGDLYEPLNLLLDFTQKLEIDEQSVEKEKGIIIQELNMYQQMSDFRLVKETFSALFEKHPLKEDIGGTEESVTATTLDELKQCFKINYHPSAMICVVVTGKDPEEVIQVIRNNQSAKKFPGMNSASRRHVKENETVNKEHVAFKMEISQPKVNVAYKLSGIKNAKERNKLEASLRFALDAYFSSINNEYQQWVNEEIINDFYGYELDFGEDYGYLMVYSETKKKEEFKKLVIDTLNKMKRDGISEEIFEQLKRRYYGENIRELNNFETIALAFIRQYFHHIHFFDYYEMMESITREDVLKALEGLNLEHFSFIECNPIH